MVQKRILIVGFLLLQLCVYAQTNLTFSQIRSVDGLSDNRVRNIIQLYDGRMLVLTEQATNLYDGTRFKIIHNTASQTALSGYIGFLHSYSDSNFVWIKDFKELKIIDIATDQFVNRPDSLFKTWGMRETVEDFFMDAQQNYWLKSANDQLMYRSGRSGKIILFTTRVSEPLGQKDVLMDLAVVDNQLFLVYKSGLMCCYNLRTHQLLYHTQGLSATDKPRYGYTLMLVQSGAYLYTLRNGKSSLMQRFDIKNRQWSTLLQVDYWLSTLSVDKHNALWVGCGKGLWKFDLRNGNKTLYTSFRLIDGTDVTTESNTLYNDAQGGLWLGTHHQGLLYYHPDRFKFQYIGASYFKNKLLEFDVTAFASMDSHGVLTGTSDGVYRYDLFQRTLSLLPGMPEHAYCTGLLKDRRENIWIFTRNKEMFRWNRSRLQKLTSPPVNTIRGMTELSDGRFFCSTETGYGIYDPTRNSLLKLTSERSLTPRFHHAISLDAHTIVGFDQRGLFLYDLSKNKFQSILNDKPILTNSRLTCLARDHNGFVWIGTADGLFCWSPRQNLLTGYYDSDGLINSSIKGILEDDKQQLWVSTAGGISRIVLHDGAESARISNFNVYDGVIENEFCQNAIYKSANGLLFIGGNKAFNVFDVNKPWTLKKLPKPLFTDLELFGRIVRPNQAFEGELILKQSITTTKILYLNHWQHSFSLCFSSLNYVNPNQSYFQYRLVGLDNTWQTINSATGSGKATFTKLKPGTYFFQLKASNNSNEWSDEMATLKIVVRPPLWMRPFAFVLYGILALALGFYLFNKLKKKAELQLKKRNEEALNELKFQFFTNISHEFRTPLTLIITPLESIIQQLKGSEMEHKIRQVYAHALELLNLVNQLLDFRRLELGGEKLHLSFGNMNDFLQPFEEMFQKQAHNKKLNFSVQLQDADHHLYFDQPKLFKVVRNLLSNAFKFTPTGGTITLRCFVQEAVLCIEVSDTGIGLSEKEAARIFDRFYQVTETNEGSGIGLHLVKQYVELHDGTVSVSSTPGTGTTFCIRIPVNLQPETAPSEPIETPPIHTPDTGKSQDSVKRSILVVEDNIELREYLVAELQKFYTVLVAESGKTAENLAKTHNPDLIISDIMMPVMDGLELCKRIKSDIQTSHIPVMLLTAKVSDEQKLQGFKAGADEYLPKPFKLEMLLLRVEQLLQQHQDRKSLFSGKIEVQPSEITISSTDERFLQKVLECMEKNMGNPDYSVQQLSLELGMDRTVLYKKMQSLLGLTPTAFIRSIRLKRAAQILKQHGHSISEVAEMVGFNTQKYFVRYFRELYGVIPSVYAQQHKQDAPH